VTTVDPSSGEPIDHYPLFDARRLDTALQRVRDRQRSWGRCAVEERCEVLRRLGGALGARREEAGALITAEMGKPISEARAEIDKCVRACEYFADHGPAMLAPETVAAESGERYVQFPPLGVVLAVMPWNYPVWQVVRAAVPALLAGNTVVLKHAANVTGCAHLLTEIFAGVDPHLLELIVISPAEVEGVISDPRVAAVTLTGSEAVGVAIATACARELKP
jgi:acyl-CoA reductase-like NAD-dependent aldehyde dehydrogenase